MTEQRALENDTLQNIMRVGNMNTNHNPKVIMYNAKHRLDMDMDIEHQTIEGSKINGGQAIFVATTITTLPNNDDLLSIKDHPHAFTKLIMDDDNDWGSAEKCSSVELVTMGIASTKKRAEMLSAADALVLLYEMGIDCRDPPNIQKQRLQAARETQSEAKLQQQEHAKAIFKADLAKAQMILETVNSSRPTFDSTTTGKLTNGGPTWVATVTCFVGGVPLSVSGKGASKKAEAEGNALIALVDSRELATIVGRDLMETYHALIEASPGQHIAPLRIPPLPDDLLARCRQRTGSAYEHELRVQNFSSIKEEYEASHRGSSGSRLRCRYRNSDISSQDKRSISIALSKEEKKRQWKATKHPDGNEARMKTIRDALPIKAIQHELIESLRTNQVVVVSGGTGSG